MRRASLLRRWALHVALWLPVAASAAVLDTPSGPVEGRVEDGVAIYRGLPYAAPPVGERRWLPPGPAPSWTTLRAATAPAPHCPQARGKSLEGGGDPGVLDEDCLYLNVFAPTGTAPGPRPVMVWLHGGALVLGGGGLSVYDGRALARRDVVVVTLNYRLGALGTFAHPALERVSPRGPVNFGLLDQIAALQWVQRHIAVFGGDPKRVTVFGQSAGAQSVLALMGSPAARGLFHGAMVQSAYGIPSHSRAKAVDMGTKIASAAGLPGARASLAALRALPADRLVALQGEGLTLAPSLVVGDTALPRTILAAFQQGRTAAVPLLIGSNSDEATVVSAFGIDPGDLIRKLGGAKAVAKALYPGIDDVSELGRQLARDGAFTAYAKRIAALQASRAPTWRYYFSHVAQARQGRLPGAGHGGEVPYVMGTTQRCDCLGAPPGPLDLEVESRMLGRWAAFATTGRPAGATDWPADDRREPIVMEFGSEETLRRGFMRARLDALIAGLGIAGAVAGR